MTQPKQSAHRYDRPTTAVICDAGVASRFLPVTKSIPKSMIPIGDTPIIQLIIQECIDAGLERAIVVVNESSLPLFEKYFFDEADSIRRQLAKQGKEKRFLPVRNVLELPIKIQLIVQDPSLPYGNGSPVRSAMPYLDPSQAFVVCYGDDLVIGSSDVTTMLEIWDRHPEANGVIMAQEVKPAVAHKYGMVQLKQDQLLDSIVEKPDPGQEPSLLASYGRYLLTPDVFRYLVGGATGKDDELWTVDAITEVAKQSPIYVGKTLGVWSTTGDPDNWLKTSVLHAQYYDQQLRQELRNILDNFQSTPE